jgi:chromosome condensin MukBEF complex kleisin-like MukF subunit
MADFTGLNQSVADLQNEVAAAVANMDKLLADLKAASPADQATIDGITSQLQAQVTALQNAVATDMAP